MIEEQIRQDILDRYNDTWEEDIEDTLRVVEECKRNFEVLVDSLIKTIKDYYEKKKPDY